MNRFKFLTYILIPVLFTLLASCSHTLKRKGPSVKADPEFLQATEKRCSYGDGRSCHLSGLILSSVDLESSIDHFRRGCSLGDGRSCFNLGVLEREAGHGLQGMKLIRRSCQVHHDAFSCFYLGDILGVDGDEGRSFLKKSCGFDYSEACYSLGKYFQKKKNDENSGLFLKKGCELNHKLSCQALESFYRSKGKMDKASETSEKVKNL